MNGYSDAMSSNGNMSYITEANSAMSCIIEGFIDDWSMSSSSCRICDDIESISDCIEAICC